MIMIGVTRKVKHEGSRVNVYQHYHTSSNSDSQNRLCQSSATRTEKRSLYRSWETAQGKALIKSRPISANSIPQTYEPYFNTYTEISPVNVKMDILTRWCTAIKLDIFMLTDDISVNIRGEGGGYFS